MATANNKVKFAYVTGSELPATTDADTVYFVAEGQKLYVGSVLIADHIDISGKQDNITVTVSGSGNYVSNVEWDSATATFTITKATLPVLSKGTAQGSGSILAGISVNDHEITETFTNTLATGTVVESAPTTDMGVANKKYVDDATAALTGAMHFQGISSTAITDGGTETATIDGSPLTPEAGDVVIYGNKEFVWGGSPAAWHELGDTADFVLKTTQVVAGEGLAGGGALSSDVTVSHAVPTGATEGAKGGTASDATTIHAITGFTTDKFGHVTAVTEGDLITAVNGAIDAKIGDLDAAEISGDYLTAVSETDGVITATTGTKGTVAAGQTGLVDGDTVYNAIDAAELRWSVIS